METIEQILTRQHASLGFMDGKVKYFSISTQWDESDTIEEAINNILEADKKYSGKTTLGYALDKFSNTGGLLTKEELERILEVIL